MASVPIKVPSVGESISEGILARWLKPDGGSVKAGEPLFELETDKASSVVPAPSSGVLKIGVAEGETVAIGATVGTIDPAGTPAAAGRRQPPAAAGRAQGRRAAPAPPARRPAMATVARSRRPSAAWSPRRGSTSPASPPPAPAAASPRETSSPTSKLRQPAARRRQPAPASARSGPRPAAADAGQLDQDGVREKPASA